MQGKQDCSLDCKVWFYLLIYGYILLKKHQAILHVLVDELSLTVTGKYIVFD